jgi:hypothetical protein
MRRALPETLISLIFSVQVSVLSEFDVLTALIGQRARRFAGRLAGCLALAATRLLFIGFEAALHNRFNMLHRYSSKGMKLARNL